MDCSPPGSSVHGIFQARVLEWGAIAFSVKLNIQKKWNAASVFLVVELQLWGVYAFRKATGSTRWWWASASASNVLIRFFFYIIHPMAVLDNNIHKDRYRKPTLAREGATVTLISSTNTFLSNWEKAEVPIDRFFSLCALCVTRSQVQICYWNVRSFTTRGGMLLTENDDNTILDGLDLCLWDEPSVVTGAQLSICRCKKWTIKWSAASANRNIVG